MAIGTGIILSEQQRDILRWYWVEHRTISEIADWMDCSAPTVQREILILRAVFRSHGWELPCFDKGRPKTAPDPDLVGVI